MKGELIFYERVARKRRGGLAQADETTRVNYKQELQLTSARQNTTIASGDSWRQFITLKRDVPVASGTASPVTLTREAGRCSRQQLREFQSRRIPTALRPLTRSQISNSKQRAPAANTRHND